MVFWMVWKVWEGAGGHEALACSPPGKEGGPACRACVRYGYDIDCIFVRHRWRHGDMVRSFPFAFLRTDVAGKARLPCTVEEGKKQQRCFPFGKPDLAKIFSVDFWEREKDDGSHSFLGKSRKTASASDRVDRALGRPKTTGKGKYVKSCHFFFLSRISHSSFFFSFQSHFLVTQSLTNRVEAACIPKQHFSSSFHPVRKSGTRLLGWVLKEAIAKCVAGPDIISPDVFSFFLVFFPCLLDHTHSDTCPSMSCDRGCSLGHVGRDALSTSHTKSKRSTKVIRKRPSPLSQPFLFGMTKSTHPG